MSACRLHPGLRTYGCDAAKRRFRANKKDRPKICPRPNLLGPRRRLCHSTRRLVGSTDHFDFARPPSLGEERFERAVEAQDREPTPDGSVSYPVASLDARRLGRPPDGCSESLADSCGLISCILVAPIPELLNASDARTFPMRLGEACSNPVLAHVSKSWKATSGGTLLRRSVARSTVKPTRSRTTRTFWRRPQRRVGG